MAVWAALAGMAWSGTAVIGTLIYAGFPWPWVLLVAEVRAAASRKTLVCAWCATCGTQIRAALSRLIESGPAAAP